MKLQPIRDVAAILTVFTLVLGWWALSLHHDKMSEAAFWTGLILVVGAEAYAKDESVDA